MAALENVNSLERCPRLLVVIKLPCCQDAENVHQEPSPHHVSCLEAAGAVADGVRPSGHREHEGVTHTHLT